MVGVLLSFICCSRSQSLSQLSREKAHLPKHLTQECILLTSFLSLQSLRQILEQQLLFSKWVLYKTLLLSGIHPKPTSSDTFYFVQVDSTDPKSGVFHKDAFLVFRALCKLSINTSPELAILDSTAVRGKVLALELVKILLENSGPVFSSSDKFLGAIRQFLCLSLLKNCASSIPQVCIVVSLPRLYYSSNKLSLGLL